MTSAALIGYALGFASMGVRDIILRGLYSFKNTWGPMITGIIAVSVNIALSILLSRYIGIMGITIASSISLTINFMINSQMLKRHIPEYRFLDHVPVLLKQLPSAVFAVAAVLVIKYFVSNNILVFLLSAVIAITGYMVILLLMRIEEVDYIKDKVLARISRK
jgi:putative peptidoglycan lipid II flippase